MGLLSWFKGKPQSQPESKPKSSSKPETPAAEVPGMNGAVEVPRSAIGVTVFEFGSVAATGDKVTLAGFCPVSEELEPASVPYLRSLSPAAGRFSRLLATTHRSSA